MDLDCHGLLARRPGATPNPKPLFLTPSHRGGVSSPGLIAGQFLDVARLARDPR